MMKTAAIILNGERDDFSIDGQYIIAADGGADFIGVKPDLLVGDLDSVKVVPEYVETIKCPVMKNYSDGELAVREAVKRGFLNINIYCALGKRLDHTLCNLSLLVLAKRLGACAVIKNNDTDIFYTEKGEYIIPAKKGKTLSIIPFMQNALIRHSRDLLYPLENLSLSAENPSRGISNIAANDNPRIFVDDGGVLIFINKNQI